MSKYRVGNLEIDQSLISSTLRNRLLEIFFKEIQRENDRENVAKLSFEEYKQHYTYKYKSAVFLGENGYVVSPDLGEESESKIKKVILSSKPEKEIIKYIYKNTDNILNAIAKLKSKYVSNANLQFYFDAFISTFKKRDYSSAIFYLTCILEKRTLLLFRSEKFRKITRIVNEGINYKQEKIFEESTEKEKASLSTLYILIEYIPSFEAFMKRTFVNDDNFGDPEFEPDFYNRNWFVHGHCSKKIEKYQVLEVLNALSTLEYMINTLQIM